MSNEPQSVFDYTVWMILDGMLRRHPQGDLRNDRGGFKLTIQQAVLDFICTYGGRLTVAPCCLRTSSMCPLWSGRACPVRTLHASPAEIPHVAWLSDRSRPSRFSRHSECWLMQRLAEEPAKSNLADAIRYTLNHWDGLTVFLTDGRIAQAWSDRLPSRDAIGRRQELPHLLAIAPNGAAHAPQHTLRRASADRRRDGQGCNRWKRTPRRLQKNS